MFLYIHSYIIEKLEAKDMFIISVDIKVCLDLRSPCIIEIPILDDVLFPNIPCDTDGTTSFPGVFEKCNSLGEIRRNV